MAHADRGDLDRLRGGVLIWSYRERPSPQTIRRFAQAALLTHGPADIHLRYGSAGVESPEHVRGFTRVLNTSSVRHAVDGHPDVTPDDFALIGEILARGTPRVNGTPGGGRGQSISWTLEIEGVTYELVETVGTKQRQLTVKTFFRK